MRTKQTEEQNFSLHISHANFVILFFFVLGPPPFHNIASLVATVIGTHRRLYQKRWAEEIIMMRVLIMM